MQKSRKNSHAAESMIETLVAITVIVMATVSALSVMRVALSGNQIIEDKVVARGLAMEGIDAVRNIRDTNYLRFAGNAEECWDKINAQVGDDCTTKTSITPDTDTDYFLSRSVDMDPLFEWMLREVRPGGAGRNDGNLDLYEFSFDSDGDGVSESIANIYADSGIAADGFTSMEHAKFRRVLSFESLSDDELQVDVTVTWVTGGVDKSISLTGVIVNAY